MGADTPQAPPDQLKRLMALLARSRTAAILASAELAAIGSGLRDCLEARGCKVLAGLEGLHAPGRMTDSIAGFPPALPPRHQSEAEHQNLGDGINVVLVLGAGPAGGLETWLQPGPLQNAAAHAMAAIRRGTPVYSLGAGPAGRQGTGSGPAWVEWLIAELARLPLEDAAVRTTRWTVAAQALRSGVVEALLEQLADFPELRGARGEMGKTLMHVAATVDSKGLVEALLARGFDWRGRDVEGQTAGSIAFTCGHQHAFDALVNHACEEERELDMADDIEDELHEDVAPKRRRHDEDHSEYLHEELRFESGRLLDSTGSAIMMGWEAPLMDRHAQVLLPSAGLDVLNIGFGLGLIDGFFQQRAPRSHTIVEAHPDVLKEMQRCGWHDRPGVKIHAGRWQDIVKHLPARSLDAIFIDTWRETYIDVNAMFKQLPRLLRQGGRFSFFNGFAPKCIFEHAMFCRMAQADLFDLGLQCDILPINVGSLGDDVWQGVRQRYWHFKTYYLPLATLASCATLDGQKPASPSLGMWRQWPATAVVVGDEIITEDSQQGFTSERMRVNQQPN
mmetsp:Transcript_3908/g.7890  ORF Transcript_3908/g.7890 Transcript_3908/m.7890 type:complete len:562 (+) Transcript_3908:80-1765(+)